MFTVDDGVILSDIFCMLVGAMELWLVVLGKTGKGATSSGNDPAGAIPISTPSLQERSFARSVMVEKD